MFGDERLAVRTFGIGARCPATVSPPSVSRYLRQSEVAVVLNVDHGLMLYVSEAQDLSDITFLFPVSSLRFCEVLELWSILNLIEIDSATYVRVTT